MGGFQVAPLHFAMPPRSTFAVDCAFVLQARIDVLLQDLLADYVPRA